MRLLKLIKLFNSAIVNTKLTRPVYDIKLYLGVRLDNRKAF